MLVEANLMTTSTLQCNTSMQGCFGPGSVQSTVYYSSEYCSKNPMDLKAVLPLLQQSVASARIHGSQAEDNGSHSRTSKLIKSKMLNKLGAVEVCDQQAAMRNLGRPSQYQSHDFTVVFIWDAVARVI